MIKKFKGRLALLGIAAALAVCGCSGGSPAETEAEDNLVQTTEAANDAEQAVGEGFIGVTSNPDGDDSFMQDMPVWIGDEAPIEGGYISAESKSDENGSPFRNMPVILYDAEPKGEGGLVPTTVIDPDGEGGLVPTTVIDRDGDDSSETEMPESEND